MHRFVDHTAELEIELRSPSREELFAEAASVVGEILSDGEEPGGETATRSVHVTAADGPALLAAWIDELVFLAESDGFVPRGADSVTVGDDTASGDVVGVLGEPRHLVKAVTFNRLQLSFADGAWHGRVVLDV